MKTLVLCISKKAEQHTYNAVTSLSSTITTLTYTQTHTVIFRLTGQPTQFLQDMRMDNKRTFIAVSYSATVIAFVTIYLYVHIGQW